MLGLLEKARASDHTEVQNLPGYRRIERRIQRWEQRQGPGRQWQHQCEASGCQRSKRRHRASSVKSNDAFCAIKCKRSHLNREITGLRIGNPATKVLDVLRTELLRCRLGCHCSTLGKQAKRIVVQSGSNDEQRRTAISGFPAMQRCFVEINRSILAPSETNNLRRE